MTSHVNAEIIDPHSRGILDGLVESGTLATLQINTDEEILRFQGVHSSMGVGEADVVLACKKIMLDGGSARGVLDDRTGRTVATEAGIEFTGLVGLLSDLKNHGVLDEGEHGRIAQDLRSSRFRLPKRF